MNYIKLGRVSVLLINLFFCLACAQAQREASIERGSQSSNEPTAQATPNVKGDQMKEDGRPQSDATSRGQRVAMREIKGCPRDNVTFFRGEVASFKRSADSIEIAIHTDWDSDERLKQKTGKKDAIIYELDGKQMKEDDWALIVSESGDVKPKLRATAWVCEKGDEKIIKIIDWHLAGSSTEGSPK